MSAGLCLPSNFSQSWSSNIWADVAVDSFLAGLCSLCQILFTGDLVFSCLRTNGVSMEFRWFSHRSCIDSHWSLRWVGSSDKLYCSILKVILIKVFFQSSCTEKYMNDWENGIKLLWLAYVLYHFCPQCGIFRSGWIFATELVEARFLTRPLGIFH